jgi:hypothetical protein|tara:strand:+ start:274 stop:507 length:234 start_codon:yes stop_codon:yes gene_type:complete
MAYMVDELRVEPNDLKLLIADRYTGAEIIERLEISAEDILDNYLEEVYNSLYKFDEILSDLDITLEDSYNETEEECT